jgi:hypothetical protein
MVFLEDMKKLEAELNAHGHEVQRPEVFWRKDQGMEPPDIKARAIRDHFSKIEWADAIVVVNPEKRGIAGYIGGNTLMEMALAFYLKKPIFLAHAVPDLGYREEIMGMQPRMIEELFG